MCQKKGKHEEEHRHAREGLVGGCAKNSSDAQSAWRRVSIAIDSGASDSVIPPEHPLDHEVHESVESWHCEKCQSAIWRANSESTLHERKDSQRDSHESFRCDKAFRFCEEDLSGR